MASGTDRELVDAVLGKNRKAAADFVAPLVEGEEERLEPDAAEHVLRASDTLETALRAFDTAGAERLPVVSPDDRLQVVGWARQVRALSWFNKALIETSVEEHR